MDVEKTIEFLLQNQTNLGEGQVRLQEEMKSLTGVVKNLAFGQDRLQERVYEIAQLQRGMAEFQKGLAESQRELTESHKETRDNLNALIRVVDDIVRRNGKR